MTCKDKHYFAVNFLSFTYIIQYNYNLFDIFQFGDSKSTQLTWTLILFFWWILVDFWWKHDSLSDVGGAHGSTGEIVFNNFLAYLHNDAFVCVPT